MPSIGANSAIVRPTSPTPRRTTRNITYSIRSPPDAVPSSICGPWSVDEMKPGQPPDDQILTVYTQPAALHTSWTDKSGDREIEEQIG